MFFVKLALKTLLLPIGLFLALLALALFMLHRRRSVGIRLIYLVFALMFVLSLPLTYHQMIWTLVDYKPLNVTAVDDDVGAIVMLTGGPNVFAVEYGREIINGASIRRARYTAFLHRRIGLPIMVAGGMAKPSVESEASSVKRFLEDEWRIPIKWLEGTSRDTAESAEKTFPMLSSAGVKDIILVTDVFHMRRAEFLFAQAGFRVTPGPVGFPSKKPLSFYDLLPDSGALKGNTIIMKEWLGIIWYRLWVMMGR